MKRTLSLLLVLLLSFSALVACTAADTQPTAAESGSGTDSATENATAEKAITVRVGGMTGPTTIGMVKLIHDHEDSDDYDFTIETAADQLVPLLLQGKLEAAAVPANLAATLYKKSEGKIRLAAVNTLGVLSILERGESLRDLSDLKGKTIYALATSKGAVPEYTIRYLLEANGLDPDTDVKFEWKSSQEEILVFLKENADAIALLPQPFVTAACNQVSDLRVAFDLNDEWEALDTPSLSVTGVLVVRADFAENYPNAYAKLLEEYEASINYVNENPDEVAPYVETYVGVKAAVAKKAIPSCNLTYMDGNQMKEVVSAYLAVLYDQNPQAVGGELPDDAFYLGAD